MSGRIAPHVGQEVRLVLAGTKPLATIEREKDESGYALAISLGNAGLLAYEVGPTPDDPTGEVVFVRPALRRLITEYRSLLTDGVSRLGIRHYHRQMGQLFGYTVADIETFINEEIDCDCSKCKGD